MWRDRCVPQIAFGQSIQFDYIAKRDVSNFITQSAMWRDHCVLQIAFGQSIQFDDTANHDVTMFKSQGSFVLGLGRGRRG